MNELANLLGQPLSKVSVTSERISRYKVSASRAFNRTGELDELLKDEVRTDLESFHARVRRELGYKRKDVSFELEEPGEGMLQTPDFDYRISASVSPERAGEVTWSREVALRSGLATDPALVNALGEELDTVIIRFSTPLEVTEIIDRIEEQDNADYQVEYDLGCEWCEISIRTIPATVRVSRSELRIYRQPGTPLSLQDMLSLIRPRA